MTGVTVTHVKKQDLVQVMVGKYRGKTGKILRVNHIIKKHTKPTQKTAGGIIEVEGMISASNVLLFCDKCNSGVRTSRKLLESGKKVRVCRKCTTQIDK